MEYILIIFWMGSPGSMVGNIPPFPTKQSCEEAGKVFSAQVNKLYWTSWDRYVCLPHPTKALMEKKDA